MTIEDRLHRLELSNRRSRVALLALGCIVFACQGVTAAYDRLQVKELIIVDGSERPVASLAGKASGVEVVIIDDAGKPKLVIDRSGLLVDRR